MEKDSSLVEKTEEVKQDANILVEDVASFYFTNLLPIFKEKSHLLSRKGQNRVLNALMHAPFFDEHKMQNKEEEDALKIGLEIMDAKHMMIIKMVEKNPDLITKMVEHFNNLAERLIKPEKGKENG